jgi:hypothetical protein
VGDVKATGDCSTSLETVAGENHEVNNKAKQPVAPTPTPQTNASSDAGASNLKRKARDDDDEERAKSRKNEEEERVFVREKGPSPVPAGKNEASSLLGGGDKKEPDMTPVKLKVPGAKK